MRNRYPGTCYRCGDIVAVNDGHFERVPGVGWAVQHADCARAYRGTEVGRSEPRATRGGTGPPAPRGSG